MRNRHRQQAFNLVLSGTIWLGALAAPAAAFPPPKARPYTGTYKMTSKTTRDGKTDTKKGTVTIAVLGNKSSWKDGDGQVTIYDIQTKKMTVYGGKSKEKIAEQKDLPAATSNWELGYQRLTTNMTAPPKEGAQGKYGGEACTLVQFETREMGNPELCITPKGVVTRYAEKSADGGETVYEAEKIDMSAPAADAFAVPPGYELKN